MNRSILLVICDFLLLSMLALARFDDPAEEPTVSDELIQTEQASPESELLELLELSLQEEQAKQAQLQSELEAKEAARQSTASNLRAAEKQLQDAESALVETQSIAEERASELLEIQQKAQEIESALSESQALKTELERELNSTQLSSEVALERLRQTEATLAEAKAEQKSLEQEKAQVESERREFERRAQRLRTELRVAETERNLISKNLENAQIQLETVQIEKQALQQQTEKLSEGVSNLAQTSQEIRKEIQDSLPQSPANIFSQFKNERVAMRWTASYSGMFGTRNRQFESMGLLVTTREGSRIVFLTEGTPFKAVSSGSTPNSVRLEIENSTGRTNRPQRIQFSEVDPRIAFIPIPEDFEIEASIQFSKDPFRFDEAVMVRPGNGFYGEADYRVSPGSDQVLEMDSRILSGLFGDFNPDQGDFVFALTGNLVGIMVNKDRAIRIENTASSQSILLNEAYNTDRTKASLDALAARFANLPSSLR
ncbi:MAG: hypothetical protein AAF212_03775 [Verrucomicrobiota bacterium]